MQSAKNVAGTDAGLFAFGDIYVYPVLREIGVERRRGHGDFGTFQQLCDEVLGNLIEIIERAACFILQVQFETVTYAITGNHRRSETEYASVFHLCGELHVESPDYRVGIHAFTSTFVPRFEFTDKRSVGITLSAEEAEPDNLGTTLHGRMRAEDLIDLHHDLFGAFLRSTGL